MLYFAYGSNLDTDQMARRCPRSRVFGTGTLPNHALCFTGFSVVRGGGVASVVPATGWSTDGLLYRVTHKDLERLDGFEGFPTVYARARKRIYLPDRRWVVAHTYIHNSDELSEPSQGYYRIIRRAYDKLGFNTWPLRIAAEEVAA